MHSCLTVLRAELKQQSSPEISTFGHDTTVNNTVSDKQSVYITEACNFSLLLTFKTYCLYVIFSIIKYNLRNFLKRFIPKTT